MFVDLCDQTQVTSGDEVKRKSIYIAQHRYNLNIRPAPATFEPTTEVITVKLKQITSSFYSKKLKTCIHFIQISTIKSIAGLRSSSKCPIYACV